MSEPRRGGPCVRCGKPTQRARNPYCSRVCKNIGDDAARERRFWAKVNKNGRVVEYVGTPCWEWTGASDLNGYGLVCAGSRHARAHRVSWEMKHGPIPSGMVACHRCDNPCCVRPDHLFPGTPADNMADRDRKGRYVVPQPKRRMRGDDHWSRQTPEKRPRGTNHGMSRLTEDAVLAMRARHAAGETACALAAEYGVAAPTARQAIRGITWGHLEACAPTPHPNPPRRSA